MPARDYAFGPFMLDPADRRLLREGEAVEVTARYFDALLLLVTQDGRLVTKDRFHEEVWAGIPVTDEALTQCIRTLRKALGDDAARPRYIETVPRHGYRFIAPVMTAGAGTAEPATRETKPPAPSLVTDIAAAALGGGTAGIVGALGYLSAGLFGTGIGTASTLLVLISVNLLLGLVAGAAVGTGIAFATRHGAWVIAGGALGGVLVGAIGHMVGNDLFALFFGRSPGTVTGALEGLVLGAAAGTGAWLARMAPASSRVRQIAPGFALGAIGGILLHLAGGKLMVGSLAALAERFPGSRLQVDGLPPLWIGMATVMEAALFAGGVAAAMTLARRMRR